MAINFNSALGIHEKALLVRERRAEVLANNLANANTPGFQARDLDFKSLLGQLVDSADGAQLKTTRSGHISSATAAADGALLYRVPMQPSLDGNTVDADVEMGNFARNAVDFQASLTFLQGKFRGLRSAIKGE